MIGYILQAVLLIGFLYIITFKIKGKSKLIYVCSILITVLALINVCINIAMIIGANSYPIDKVFSYIYLGGLFTYILSMVIVVLVLVTTITVGSRTENIESINEDQKKKHGDDANLVEIEKVSIKDIFPQDNSKVISLCVFGLMIATILVTVFLSGFINETEPSYAKSFDELEFEIQDNVDLDKAINLLDEAYSNAGNQEIKDILDGLYEGERLSVPFYTEEKKIKTNYEEMSFYYEYMSEYAVGRYDNFLRYNVKHEGGIYDAVGFEYYRVEKKELVRYNIFLLYGGAIVNEKGEMEGLYPLVNVHCWRTVANLSYAPLDFWGSRFEYEFEYEFLAREQ